MAAHTDFLIERPPACERTRPIRVCHFTTAHTQLKSRSFHRQCLPLAASGFEVRYVAPVGMPGSCGGVCFVSLPTPSHRLRRFVGLPELLRTLLRQQANVYYFQDPQLFPAALMLETIFRKRVVYDAYEDFPAVAARHRSIPRYLRPIAALTLAGIERLAVRLFDGVITADPLTLARLARHGKSKKLVFYNFPNLDFFPPPRPRAKFFDIVYRGGLSERAGTFVLLEALRILAAQHEIGARPKLPRLLLIGYFDDAAAEKILRERILTFGLQSCVEIRGRLAHECMADALSKAHIGVCPLQDVPKFRTNIPVKVFESWACGLPVVASDLPPIRPFFRNGYAGLLFPPGNAGELASAIAWLLDRPQVAAEMGGRGREIVEKRLNNAGETSKLRRFLSAFAPEPVSTRPSGSSVA